MKSSLLIGAWSTCLLLGFFQVITYETTPGAEFSAPTRWPEHTALALDHAKPTALLFLHPKCPCSQATLEQLDKIMTHVAAKAKITVIFYQAASQAPSWHQTSLFERALRMKNVTSYVDNDGIETKKFNAITSGSLLVYDTNQQLLFHGGITGARGHSGDNDGSDAVIDILNGTAIPKKSTFVYGCPITGAGNSCPLKKKG